ncbi:MAG: ABC transporter substrate-binding protein [Rhodoferax sp.]|nr:ABC transporter substrate-binding protein [Rhodoferax sp.]
MPPAPLSMATLTPQRIVCLTEETTEWLYLLGQEWRIVGISGYTVRPKRAREEKPRVSAFTSAKLDKILALQPDCVLGFSDMQADIAAALIRAGVPVTVFNQRSVAEILGVLYQVAAMVGQGAQGLSMLQKMQLSMQSAQALGANFSHKPKVYFEEWDTPRISAIRWVSELIGVAGGQDIFPELAAQPLGKHRILADDSEIIARNPDIIIGSWCGKKFRPELVAARPGWGDVAAVKTGQLFEIKSADILQPGPAALTDGLAQLHRIIMDWQRDVAPGRTAAHTGAAA